MLAPMPDQPTEPPLDPRTPFTRAAGLRAGLGKRLRGRSYRQLLHGIYVSSAVEVTPLVEAQAALLRYADTSWASHISAARVLGVPTPTLAGNHVTVTDPKHRHSRAGVTCHLAKSGSVIEVGGTRVSAPAQLFLELASQLTLVDLVVAGDHLVRRLPVTLTALREFCAKATGPGAAHARAAAAFVRENVDSPMETRLRMLIVLAGLPEPVVNLTVDLPTGRRRYDLCWPEARLVVEYDGRHHVERVEQWEADIARREAIEDDAWRMLVITSTGIFRTPNETVAKIHRLLLARRQPDTPRTLSDAWRHHFPVRGDYLAPPAAI